MSLTPADITTIVAALQESEWDYAEVVIGDVRIAVARNGVPIDPAPAAFRSVPAGGTSEPHALAPRREQSTAEEPPQQASASPSPTPTSDSDHVVKAPSVGVFWRSPEPGAEPFVSVGAKVTKGDTVAIVEVMKLMSNIPAPVSGTVTAIHVDNGASVEFDSPLITIAVDDE